MDQAEIPQHLAELSARVAKLAGSIIEQVERTNETVALANLGRRCSLELERCSKLYPWSIEGVAWCARNLFEVDLILRHIMKSPDHLNAWLGQVLTDERQILEGALSLSEEKNRPEVQLLRDRLRQIDQLGAKHRINPSAPFEVKTLAKLSGVSKEYDALYKLFSKYTHPSAYVVNMPEQPDTSSRILNVFLVHATLYSGYTYKRLEDWLARNRANRPLH